MNVLSPAQEHAHEVFLGGNNIIITGPSSSGKSYLQHFLWQRYSDSRDLWLHTVENGNMHLPAPYPGAQVVVNAGPASADQVRRMAQHYHAIITAL